MTITSCLERQKMPSDYDILISQRPIAVHRLEHLGIADRGVAMLRRLVRRGIDQIRNGEAATTMRPEAGHPLVTYAHDTILDIPPGGNGDDRELLRRIGGEVSDIVIESRHNSADRTRLVQGRLKTIVK